MNKKIYTCAKPNYPLLYANTISIITNIVYLGFLNIHILSAGGD